MQIKAKASNVSLEILNDKGERIAHLEYENMISSFDASAAVLSFKDLVLLMKELKAAARE